ncbi:hypothetical protein VTH06DRAFT_4740 [Thermothelomyces fergusii]
MKRILLLVFIHGFKGTDFTFGDFPTHLRDTVANNLPDHVVETVIHPKYETRGELAQSVAAFSEWLKERVMDLRKTHLDNPWPPNDRKVGVVLVAHSMGGFVATDCLFRILDEHRRNETPGRPLFPLIQGILAFDTPLNGLARSMFVYGAFSHYQKVSNVFNVMTALSAVTPAALSRLASKGALGGATGRVTKRTAAAATAATTAATTASSAWKAWQLVAVRTGAVGIIAAGGVAAFVHRRKIVEGARAVRGLSRRDVVRGYRHSVDALGQGLAYINRGNVGRSFAWLADHFTFVGALLKPNELDRRLRRLGALRGVGVRDVYASLGENGYWSGGYFVPERTFCAVPSDGDAPEAKLFARHVVDGAKDEIAAHIGLFRKEKNRGYERMTSDAAELVVRWFADETEIYDDPRFQEAPPAERAETEAAAAAVDKEGIEKAGERMAAAAVAEQDSVEEEGSGSGSGMDIDGDEVPDESPIDIAAAASLVPLPDDVDEGLSEDAGEDGKDGKDDKDKSSQQKAYLRHLFGVAQQTGTTLRAYLPTKLPTVEMPRVSMPAVNLPSMPAISSIAPALPAMPSMAVPARINPFSRKTAVGSPSTEEQENGGDAADEKSGSEERGVPRPGG